MIWLKKSSTNNTTFSEILNIDCVCAPLLTSFTYYVNYCLLHIQFVAYLVYLQFLDTHAPHIDHLKQCITKNKSVD